VNNNYHIIWDFNGTLVDDAWLFVELMNKLLKKRKLIERDVTFYRQNFCFPLYKYYEKLGFDLKREPFELPSVEFINLYEKNKYRANLFNGILLILKKLKASGHSNYIVSAQYEDSLLDLVSFYKLSSYFKIIRGTNNLHAIGKDLIAKELISKFDKTKNRIIIIGDTNMDINIAKENNCQAVGITYGHQSENRFIKYNKLTKVNSVSDLNAYLSPLF